ncbi:MAG TPA: hypothetical protein VFO72_06490 [Pyrinomonadaceae bacterium]|nr:hypothetical protein [Pyrinomonadaceae bacterium]
MRQRRTRRAAGFGKFGNAFVSNSRAVHSYGKSFVYLVTMQFETTNRLPGTAGVSPASDGSVRLVTVQARRLRSQQEGASVFKRVYL